MRKKIIWGAAIVAISAVVVVLEMRDRVPFNSVLEIQLNGAIEEQRPAPASSQNPTISGSDGVTVRELATAVDAARDDQRVSGLVLRIGNVNASPASVEELAARIAAFRKSGKGAICLLDDEHDDSRANAIASWCDEKPGERVSSEGEVEEFFDNRLGEDNWSPIELLEYLKQVRQGS